MALNMNTGAAVYNPATAAQAPAAAAQAQAGKNRYSSKEEIDGYFNIYLPSEDGGYAKFGAISVSLKADNQKALTEWLLADPSAAAALLPLMKVTFQPSRNEGRNFDIAKLKAAAEAAKTTTA